MDEAPRVAVIGESLIDVVQSPAGREEIPGGSPMNVAIGLGRLGVPVGLATQIGDDARGRAIRDHLRGSGVQLIEGSQVAGTTSTSTVLLDARGTATYEFEIVWSPSSLSSVPASAIVHTGSIAAFPQPGADDVEGFMADASSHAVTTFDPNIRPSLLGSHTEAKKRVERITSTACVVKLSDEDAEWLYPDRDVNWVLAHLLDLGSSLAVMTRGGHGATLLTRQHSLEIRGADVVVVDTIGAGDSFMSAVLSSLDGLLAAGAAVSSLRSGAAFSDRVLVELGEFAATCAGVTVSRAGADPPSRAEAHAARR